MDRTQQLEEALREELADLWSDLSNAVNYALNGQWSMQCDNLASRIQAITKLVGPTTPEAPPSHLRDGGATMSTGPTSAAV